MGASKSALYLTFQWFRGTATLIGDTPNIMIGYHANLTFGDFILNDGILIAIIGIISVPLTPYLAKRRGNGSGGYPPISRSYYGIKA
ncbi:MAG TPA: hypothetical protein VMZ04_06640 [Anaerolineae bacterium]|nr:hypothetical protein [Anaerolineae bacterium]